MSTKAGGVLFRMGYYFYSNTRLGYYYHKRNIEKAKALFSNGHSITTPHVCNGLQIVPIALIEDNYSYLIVDDESKTAVVVDPSDASVVQAVIETEGVNLKAILTTHKHWDHSGGNSELKSKYPDLLVYGSNVDNVPALTNNLNDGEQFTVGCLKFTARFTPGHTIGHTIYILDASRYQSPGHVFTGDLLFMAGTGRMFESSAMEMLQSLDKVCELADDTFIWPGHEYAKSNLTFVQHIEPSNDKVKKKLDWVIEQRKERKMTIPSTLKEEMEYNPFLRTHTESILEIVGLKIDDECKDKEAIRAKALEELRTRKDKYSYKL
ncbi:probable hydrolase PNKD [Antedon mediterranea]|uniref:probable hydrolase PNKD n=1 Tax=Antedon mediterranea TaxID=105859 RepID=UPI003AF93AA2